MRNVRMVTFGTDQEHWDGSHGKCFFYGGTLQDIALRLNLITDEEILQARIADSLAVICPRCGREGSPNIVAQFGRCLNC